MPARKVFLLSALLAVLTLLALYLQGPGRRNRPAGHPPVFPGLEVSEVERMTVRKPGETVLLHREGDGWKVGEEGYRADARAVQGILEDLAGLTPEAIASRSGGKEGLFGLGTDDGTEVSLAGAEGSVLAEFGVGREGPDRFSTYVKVKGEERVLLVPSRLRPVFDRSVEGWRERRILELEPETIGAVSVRLADGAFTLERGDDGTWSVGGRPADTGRVASYLRRISTLRAVGFPSSSETEGVFDDPAADIVLRAGTGEVTVQAGGAKTESGERYVRTGAGDTVFLVGSYAADELLRDEAYFLLAE